MAAEHEEEILEPELKPEYIEKLGEIEKQKTIGPYDTVDDLKAYIDSLPDED